MSITAQKLVTGAVLFVIAWSMYYHGLAVWDEGRHADGIVWVACAYAVAVLIIIMLLEG